PIPTIISFIVTKLAGPSYFSIRILCAISGVLTIWLLMLSFLRVKDIPAALFALFFSSFNMGLIAHCRGAYLEPYLLCTQALLYWLIFKFRKTAQHYFWIGLLDVLSFGVKPSAVLFGIPLFIVALALSRIEPDAAHDLNRTKSLLKGAISGCILYGTFAVYNWKR